MLSGTDYLGAVARAEAYSSRAAWPEAATMWAQVVTANPVNGNHWDRLADARLQLGDDQGAIAALEEAMRLGVTATREDAVAPGELLFRVACCHARLGDAERALTTLSQAIGRGYRDVSSVLVDDHFRTVRDDPRFRDMVGSVPEGEISRDDGWRLNAQVLSREIARRAPAWPGAPAGGRPDVTELIRLVPQLTDAQIVMELTKLVARLDDGHAFIDVPEQDSELSRVLPLQFYLFEEGLFIVATTRGYRRLLGAKVEAFDGHGVAEVLAALHPVISYDNEYGAKERVVQVLRRLPILHAMALTNAPDVVTLNLRLLDQDATDTDVAAEPGAWMQKNELPAPPGWLFFPDTLAESLPLYLKNCGDFYWFEHLPADRTVYFQFNTIRDHPHESFAAFSQRLFQFVESHQAEQLVIDLRWNGGGNNMLVAPLIHGLIRSQRINRRGGLFVITGRRTFSAAQYTATVIEANTHAIFVGEPTGSRPNFVGETTPFRLPYGGIRANISDIYWQNSWPLDQRGGIAPELYTPPAFAAFRSNRDPAMEAVAIARDSLPRT